MPCQTVTRFARRCGGLALAELPPAYLAPSLHFSLGRTTTTTNTTTTGQCSGFSSTAAVAGRGRDLSKSRGVSAIHRSGPKFRLGASKYPLPTPASPEVAGPRNSTPQHGLWGFFPKGKAALGTPEYDVAHGRSWSVQELREKSWDDLHKLWWVCVKERNRIATSNLERERLKAGYGEYEASERDRVVRVTQKSIKHVLRERWYAWEDAQKLYEQGYRPQNEE